jgi:hypothetical protein
MNDDLKDVTDDVTELNELVERWIALWNEPDAAMRRQALEDLWAPDTVQVLADPPQEVRDAAANLRFGAPTFEVHGLDALEARVTRAYEMFVAPGEHYFRARGSATQLLTNVVAYTWDMVARADDSVAGTGCDVMVLTPDTKIRANYQFIQP